MQNNPVMRKARQTGMSFTMTDELRDKFMAMQKASLQAARFWRLGTKAPKVKALRRKLGMLKTKPVPDTGVIYERAGTKYKVQPNGEWRRVKD
jgi:hypothetical protein